MTIQDWENMHRASVLSPILSWKELKIRAEQVYQMQIKDKACTICVNVHKGGAICKECLVSRTRKNWENAYEEV